MIFIAFSEMIVEMRGGALVDELGDDLHQPFSRLKYTILFHQFHGEITILHFLFDGWTTMCIFLFTTFPSIFMVKKSPWNPASFPGEFSPQ